MFSSIDLVDFQSHRNTHLPLGAFTVIVGPSSSGKSAVVRALRLAAENARGTAYVRQGAKTARVVLEQSAALEGESTVVTVERGKTTSIYTLRVPGVHAEPIVFTKCASSVPDAVAQALGLGDSALWIAGQFDTPYLLGATGSEVARVLGRLTRVDLIYAAARETNRRTAEARRAHASRSTDLAEARASIGLYATLPQRLAAGKEAEQQLTIVEQLASERSALADRVVSVRGAVGRSVDAHAQVVAVPSVVQLTRYAAERSALASRVLAVRTAEARRVAVRRHSVSVPSVSSLTSLLAERASLKAALDGAVRAVSAREVLVEKAKVSRASADAARDRFMSALASAGECPLCGASAAHAQVDHVV